MKIKTLIVLIGIFFMVVSCKTKANCDAYTQKISFEINSTNDVECKTKKV